jgi:hypothetical protein
MIVSFLVSLIGFTSITANLAVLLHAASAANPVPTSLTLVPPRVGPESGITKIILGSL